MSGIVGGAVRLGHHALVRAVGQGLYGVVEISAVVAGLSASRRRVLALEMRYLTRERTVYE